MTAIPPEAGVHAAGQAIESIAPLLAVVLPIIFSLPLYLIGKISQKARDATAVGTALLSFLLVVSLYPAISAGKNAVYDAGFFFVGGMKFYVDATGFLFALVTSFIWLLATIYSTEYMKHEHAQERYFAFFMLTLGANLGVLMTGDLFSLFIFFELLGLSSWVLVVHAETPTAMNAGKKYLFINIIGGLITLLGIFLFYTTFGTLSISPILEKTFELGSMRYIIAVAMLAGFAVKAGMFPVHVWLPEAHPVAPSPASALLSGIMVKAGIYGMIRTLLLLFSPAKDIELWHLMQGFGFVLLWLGIFTIFVGGILALLQSNIKRLLAYSTISQIGYIVMDIGFALYAGYEGTIPMSGAIMHFMNHAMYKSLFFLAAGSIYFATHELDMHKFGGLWKRMPVTFLVFVIAILGITGAPFFNGYISKSILFESISEAAKENSVFSLAIVLFLLGSSVTVAYQLKMLVMTFFGEEKEASKHAKEVPLPMLLPMITIAAVIITIGVAPNFVISKFIAPIAGGYTVNHELAEELVHARFFNIHGLQEFLGVSVFGIFLFSIAWQRKMLEMQIPRYIGVDYYYEKAAQYFVWLIKGAGTTLDNVVDKAYVKESKKFLQATKTALEFDKAVDKRYVKGSEKLLEAAKTSVEVEKAIEKGVIAANSRIEAYAPEEAKAAHAAAHAHAYEPPLRGETFLKEGERFASFDLKVIDGAVNMSGRSGVKAAFKTGGFDLSVVDGAVNGVAEILHVYGDWLRRAITGMVSDYATGVALGIILISIIVYITGAGA